ncbi:MAG: methyltransferase domain-containing protein [Alphaproteobacteria bacterium]
MTTNARFNRYLDATKGRPPRETTLQALELFDEPGLAVDLGCGAGRDALPMLQRGWRVLGIDSNPEAIRRLAEAAGDDRNLQTQVAGYAEAEWPACELVNSSFALPFCPAADFADVWRRIVASLRPGGVFAGQLFGPNDDFAKRGIVVQTRAEVEALLDGLEIIRLDEVEEDGTTAVGEGKHWHIFHIVVRKPEEQP